ncbi:uncharacterized protein LOC129457004 [Periophthalmus magnuspinnatus]|uniref:uncharacterized protein LOC129457004 n=1 Tax=Periophthalmus magnuspinnatus TaxID=409849 RepID=UPI0024366CD1|nr:uncharacterized protein LOC129457004 [Periophthalmus magnuspinnatus]
MSKHQTLRALVTERLTAAAEEIFALFERTIADYEEELCRSKEENQRNQESLDSVLSPRLELLRSEVQILSVESLECPGSDRDTPRIKEEPEEQSVKQEKDTLTAQLPVGVAESSSVCLKSGESSLLQQRQTEAREETQGEDISTEPHLHTEIEGHTEYSSDTDNDEDWTDPFSCSAAQMETEADGDHYNQVQKAQTLRALVNEQLTMAAEEMGLNQDTPQTPWIKEEPEEQSVKQKEEQMSYNMDEVSDITDCEKADYVPDSDGNSADGVFHGEELEIMDDQLQKLKQLSIKNVTSCSMETYTGYRETDTFCYYSTAQNSVYNSSEHSAVRSSTDMVTNVSSVPVTAKMGKYKKRQYCLFCQKPIYKIARHLGTVHRDEQDVALAFSFRKGSKKRKEMLRSLKNRGNFSHNAIVASSGIGELVACRRPGASQPPQAFVHCMFCQGLYARKGLWRHMKYSHKESVQGESGARRKRIHMHLSKSAFSPQDEVDISEDDYGEGVSTDQHQIEDPKSQDNIALPKDTSEANPEHSISEKVGRRKRRNWTHCEVTAVEQHMMDFITHGQVPGKRSCDSCLQSEPQALKDRDWIDIKNYVHNRINALKKKPKK